MACRHYQCDRSIEEVPVTKIHEQSYSSVADVNNRLNQIEQQNAQIIEALKKVLENTEILKKKSDAILRQTFELTECTVPTLFIVLPDETPHYNPAHWFHLNYRLHFLCEGENNEKQHFAFHDGYKIKRPREFFRKYGSYLRKMLTVVKYAIAAGSLIIPQLKHVASGIPNSFISENPIFWNNLNIQIERLDEILKKAKNDPNILTEEKVQYVKGAELRGIESFLRKTDDHRTYGNLFRTVTEDGHVRWVCYQHYHKPYAMKTTQELQKNFEKLGGKIEGDVAIIHGQFFNKFPDMLSVLGNGLQIFSISLKDIKLEKDIFGDLLVIISRQSLIRNLEIENITVSCCGFIMKKRYIISKLNDTLKNNSKLNILYSFTKSLLEFTSKLIDTITETNSSLIFRIRSQENYPSFELVGTNKTGFTLTITNGSVNDDVGYMTAVNNSFPVVKLNITKIHFQNGVISESVWACFCYFLSQCRNMQELIINCLLTLEQTRKLGSILDNNFTLKTLHMFNIWKSENESEGFDTIFKILSRNSTLTEFILKCHTNLLQLSLVAIYLVGKTSLRVLRLPKCRVYKNDDVKSFENFLAFTPFHTLSIESIITNSKASLERLARALDKYESLEILELKVSD